MENQMRAFFDAGAAVAILGTLAQTLPPTAAAVAIVWYGIQMWQSETGKNWRTRWKKLFTRQPLSTEDRVCFVILGVGGSGTLIIMKFISRLVQ